MKNVKLLYGSQNFGCNTENSDRDFLEFVFPTWEDLLDNKFMATEKHNEDGSVTKIKDIRLLLSMLKKANVSDFQILFSQETENEESLKWFLDNRNELTRMNLTQCFETNKGYCLSLLRKPLTGKNLARACATVLFLKSLTTETTQLCFPQLKEARKSFNKMNEKEKEKVKEQLEKEVDNLAPFFKGKKFNEKLFAECESEMLKLLKSALL